MPTEVFHSLVPPGLWADVRLYQTTSSGVVSEADVALFDATGIAAPDQYRLTVPDPAAGQRYTVRWEANDLLYRWDVPSLKVAPPPGSLVLTEGEDGLDLATFEIFLTRDGAEDASALALTPIGSPADYVLSGWPLEAGEWSISVQRVGDAVRLRISWSIRPVEPRWLTLAELIGAFGGAERSRRRLAAVGTHAEQDLLLASAARAAEDEASSYVRPRVPDIDHWPTVDDLPEHVRSVLLGHIRALAWRQVMAEAQERVPEDIDMAAVRAAEYLQGVGRGRISWSTSVAPSDASSEPSGGLGRANRTLSDRRYSRDASGHLERRS